MEKNKNKKVSARKTAVKKTVAKKVIAKKVAPKNIAAKKASVKKVVAVKTSPGKNNDTRGRIISIAKKMGKYFLYTLGVVLGIVLLVFIYVNLPVPASTKDIPLGVTFSSRYATDIGLNWRDAYSAMLDDLDMKRIRIPIYWDTVEKTEGQYDFSDLDWQLDRANQHGAKVILVMGKKVPRWPETYVPGWVGTDLNTIDSARLQQKLLAFETVVINRYKDNHPEIEDWQIENEPFLDFGIGGKVDPTLLDAEIANAKSIDAAHPIVVTDSGELSLWMPAARRADVFGTTMYREVYSARQFFGKPLGHWTYPIGPNFFVLKKMLISIFAHQNNAIVIELQGEPWVQGWTTSASLSDQLASMNATTLKDNIEFAKKTGFSEIYVWGVEWWYWLKIQHDDPSLWNQAKALYNPS